MNMLFLLLFLPEFVCSQQKYIVVEVQPSPVGPNFLVKWSSQSLESSSLSIYLLQDDSLIQTLASSYPASKENGTFVPKKAPLCESNYKVLVQDSNDPSVFGYSSFFALRGVGQVSFIPLTLYALENAHIGNWITVTWSYVCLRSETVLLTLWKGFNDSEVLISSSLLYAPSQNKEYSGSYYFDVYLACGPFYRLKIEDSGNSSVSSYSPFFDVAGKGSISITSPTVSTVAVIGGTVFVAWEFTYINCFVSRSVNIFLYRGNSIIESFQDFALTSHQNATVKLKNSLEFGGNYKIQVADSRDEQTSGYSPFFPVVYQLSYCGSGMPDQLVTWERFRSQLNGSFIRFTMTSSLGGSVTCSGSEASTSVALALHRASQYDSPVCGTFNWHVQSAARSSVGISTYVGNSCEGGCGRSACGFNEQCMMRAVGFGWALRPSEITQVPAAGSCDWNGNCHPCAYYSNWGGGGSAISGGTHCQAPSQTLCLGFIPGGIFITFPPAFMIYRIGGPIVLSWTTEGLEGRSIGIYLYQGDSLVQTLNSSYSGATTNVMFTLNNDLYCSSNYKVILKDYYEPAITARSTDFTITGSGEIIIVSPRFSDLFQRGDWAVNMQWNSNNCLNSKNAFVYLWKGDFVAQAEHLLVQLSAKQDVFQLSRSLTCGGNYRLKFVPEQESEKDFFSAFFSIIKSGKIFVSLPNSDVTASMGEMLTVEFLFNECLSGTKVDINLFKGSELAQSLFSIDSSEHSNKPLVFTLPLISSLNCGADYRVQIVDTGFLLNSNFSAPFSIVGTGKLFVTHPSTATVANTGGHLNISWLSNSCLTSDFISIYLYCGGFLVETFSVKYPVVHYNATFLLESSLREGENYQVVIEEFGNKSVAAASAFFSISKAEIIPTTSPSPLSQELQAKTGNTSKHQRKNANGIIILPCVIGSGLLFSIFILSKIRKLRICPRSFQRLSVQDEL